MSSSLWGQETKHFHLLSPDQVLRGVENRSLRTTGKIIALNSLENRVYDVELAKKIDVEDGFAEKNVVVKYYRPGRWSKEQILEEHRYLIQLKEFEIPVVAPIELANKTLFFDEEAQLHFALFPKVMGRLKDELMNEEIDQVGRLIGRIHNIGPLSVFKHRLKFNPENFVSGSHQILSETNLVDFPSFRNYLLLLPQLEKLITPYFTELSLQRIHGDFHRGNIVWTSAGPFAVDFDDCLIGPVEQDLWLLFPGQDHYAEKDRERFLDAYKEMTRKDHLKIHMTEIFRAMRMVHFNAWITKRWDDHSFQKMFPHFTSPNYWDQQLIDIRVQISHIQENFGTGFVY